MALWNVGGWAQYNDSKEFLEGTVLSINSDIICITETFLKHDNKLDLNGYTWFGNNRQQLSEKAKRGSGGVGAFINNDVLKYYQCEILDDSYEDILWLKLHDKQNSDDNNVILCICYLPPEGSSRFVDPDDFYNVLLTKVYEFQSLGVLCICGDFNGRCGDIMDFVEGVDDIPVRNVIDETVNYNGEQLIDMLINCNMCMLNGRSNQNNFTSISTKGRAVVDYVLVFHEQLTTPPKLNFRTPQVLFL